MEKLGINMSAKLIKSSIDYKAQSVVAACIDGAGRAVTCSLNVKPIRLIVCLVIFDFSDIITISYELGLGDVVI